MALTDLVASDDGTDTRQLGGGRVGASPRCGRHGPKAGRADNFNRLRARRVLGALSLTHPIEGKGGPVNIGVVTVVGWHAA
jgi:hypothetical protein